MPRVVVFDRENHEPLTIITVPMGLHPENPNGAFLPRQVWFWLEPDSPFYQTPITEAPAPGTPLEPISTMHTSVTFEPVMRRDGSSSRVLFWYAYADDPTLALRLRAAFLPGQIAENKRQREEAYLLGVFKGLSI